MLKQTLALAALIISLSSNAAIVDLGNITRDTATGLDWLDLTETNGRSYLDISSQLGDGQEFDGWRFATSAEVQLLWASFGVVRNGDLTFGTDDDRYIGYLKAINYLGDTNVQDGIASQNLGYVLKDPSSDFSVSQGHRACCLASEVVVLYLNAVTLNDSIVDGTGSYLVAPSVVPMPAAAWLFGSALIGLAGIKRKK